MNSPLLRIRRSKLERQCGVAVLLAAVLGLANTQARAQVSAAEPVATSAPDAARRMELITLVRQDCGSCHGLTLKGGLGPALLPDSLKDKPAESLKATILYGRPGTAMPPWRRFVTEAEAQWIVLKLQQGFPSAH